MHYRESKEKSQPYKEQYLQELEDLIRKLEQKAEAERSALRKYILKDKEKYRKKYLEMLGWPLTEPRESTPPDVSTEKLSEDGEYGISRMQVEVLEGLHLTGLLIRHNDHKKRPFVITQHGALGTPELISGVYGGTSNYNDMVERVLKAGANVFVPQLLIWSVENYGVEFDRQMLDAKLKKVGSSITAVEVYGIMHVLDYFQNQDWVGNLGMVGLSYGGFYTLFTAAADTRIKAAISCSFFCEGNHHALSDWSFQDMDKCFGEAEIACLVHPRKLFLEMGNTDELFDVRKSQAEYEKILEACGDDSDWVEFTAFPGNHEFYREDDHIRRLVEHLKQAE